MPTPKRGEEREDFVSRCVPVVIEDQGLDADDEGDRKQAVAICFDMWRRPQEGKSMEDETVVVDDNETTEREDKQATAHTAARLHGVGGIFSAQGVGEEEKAFGGATSFAELLRMQQASEIADTVGTWATVFKDLTANIMLSPDIEDKAAALGDLAKEFTRLVEDRMGDVAEKAVWTTRYVNDLPDSAFLYVEPGDKDGEGKTVPRSKRHFPYKDAGGKADIPHVRNAIARIPQSNAPGLSAAKKRQLQERARRILRQARGKEAGSGSLLDRVVAAVKSVLAPEAEEPEADGSQLMLWKEGDRYRWLAVFSNKYRDNDSPPEILASFAHKEFVAAVDAGEWPMPELRHWHVPGTRWGLADWLAYDDDTGFVLASGWVDAGHEKEAEAVTASDESVRVSHGMPREEIRREEDDPTVITRYRSKEISDLPAWAAANALTGFDIFDKEVNAMSLPDEKKAYLKRVGLSDEKIGQIEADLEGKAKAADEMGLEHKETEETPQEAPATEEPQEEPQPAYVTREEVAEAFNEATQTFAKVIQAELKALRDEIEALKQSDEEKIAEAVRTTPAASLAAVLTDVMVKGFAGVPVGEDEEIKGPEETPHETDEGGIPLLTALSGGGDWRATLGVQEEN